MQSQNPKIFISTFHDKAHQSGYRDEELLVTTPFCTLSFNKKIDHLLKMARDVFVAHQSEHYDFHIIVLGYEYMLNEKSTEHAVSIEARNDFEKKINELSLEFAPHLVIVGQITSHKDFSKTNPEHAAKMEDLKDRFELCASSQNVTIKKDKKIKYEHSNFKEVMKNQIDGVSVIRNSVFVSQNGLSRVHDKQYPYNEATVLSHHNNAHLKNTIFQMPNSKNSSAFFTLTTQKQTKVNLMIELCREYGRQMAKTEAATRATSTSEEAVVNVQIVIANSVRKIADNVIGDIFVYVDGRYQNCIDYKNSIAAKTVTFEDQFVFAGENDLAWEAAKKGDLAALQELLQHHEVNVNAKNSQDRTLMHFACHCNQTKIVELLLAYRVDLYDTDENGMNPFHIAALRGNLEAFQMLCYDPEVTAKKMLSDRYEALVATDQHDSTPLHLASFAGHAHIVSMIITIIQQHKAHREFIAKNSSGDTPLHCAVRADNVHVVEVYAAAEISLTSTNKKWQTPLHVACINGNFAMVKLLCQDLNVRATMAKRDDEDKNAFYYAACNDDVEIVRHLLSVGFSLDNKEKLLDHLAVKGAKKVLELLKNPSASFHSADEDSENSNGSASDKDEEHSRSKEDSEDRRDSRYAIKF